jgi:succinate-semialdehyde dehydrogenase/glutarate-semialdehyde dehydrogenase
VSHKASSADFQNRIYVQSGIYDKFAKLLADKVAAFKSGDPFTEGVTIGPLVNARGADKVERHVQDAVQKGARIVQGGKRGEGSFFEPTVIVDVPADALLSSEETFGPLAALFKFETEEEAVTRANESEFGLAGYFYTKDVSRVHRVSEAMQVGMVAVNTGILSQPCIPFGGIKQSGFGREGGKSGLDEYMVEKVRSRPLCIADEVVGRSWWYLRVGVVRSFT